MRKGSETIRAVSPHGAIAVLHGDSLHLFLSPERTHYNVHELGRTDVHMPPLVGVIPIDWVVDLKLNQ